jgi:hypothetical protein
MAKVTGVGGVFFKSRGDRAALAADLGRQEQGCGLTSRTLAP